MASQTVQIDEFTVVRSNILTTAFFVHAVYEPSQSGARPWSHHVIRSGRDFGVPDYLGLLGTRDLPADLEALPAMTERRRDAVQAFRQAQYDQAYDLIVRAFPAAATGRRAMGEITTHEPPAV